MLDGVVVARHTVEAWRFVPSGLLGKLLGKRAMLGLQAVVAVEPGALDLSQFAVRELETERYVKLLSPHAEVLLKTVQENLSSFYFVNISRKYAPVAGVGVGAQVAFLSVVSHGAMLLPAMGAIAAGVAINTAAWRNQLKKCLDDLRQTIRAQAPTI